MTISQLRALANRHGNKFLNKRFHKGFDVKFGNKAFKGEGEQYYFVEYGQSLYETTYRVYYFIVTNHGSSVSPADTICRTSLEEAEREAQLLAENTPIGYRGSI